MSIRKILSLTMIPAILMMSGCSSSPEPASEPVTSTSQTTVKPTEADTISELPAIKADVQTVLVEDASEVYKNVNYNNEMLFGKYILDGTRGTQLPEDKAAEFAAEMDYMNISTFDFPVTSLPYRIEAGPHSNVTAMNYLQGHNFMNLYFCSEDGKKQAVQASYSVRGNVISLNPVKKFTYDADASQLDYEFTGKSLKYTFEFDGINLTLTNGSKSVTLHAEDLFNGTGTHLYESTVTYGSEMINNIEMMSFTEEENRMRINGKEINDASIVLDKSGLARITWYDGFTGTNVLQAAYFYCDDDGIILTDGKNSYYYTSRSWDLYTQNVTANLSISDAEKLQEMDIEDIEEIVSKNDELYSDLEEAFRSAGINATVNRDTGEVALDSIVLFPSDGSSISDEGKELLNNFIREYTSVIFNEKYEDFVKSVEIEGHTDSSGSYDYNMQLSQRRADSVKDYCLSGDTGVDDATRDKLAQITQAIGRSYDTPIYDDDGDINMSASRRVSFRFIINVE